MVPGAQYLGFVTLRLYHCILNSPMDKCSARVRSKVMSRIRGTGNRSTEARLRAQLIASGIRGWRVRMAGLPGRPDFVFPARRIALFVDGCFWHLCPQCGRPPKSNRSYWKPKLESNRNRDRKITSKLKGMGWKVLRLWEHELNSAAEPAIPRVLALLDR